MNFHPTLLKITKFILLPSLAILVVSGVLFFTFDSMETLNIPLEEKSTLVDSTDENIIFQENTVSVRDSIPYSPSNIDGEPTIGVLSVELSNMPLLNEIINFTAVIQNTHYDENAKLTFILTGGWEFVNVPESEFITLLHKNETIHHAYGTITVGLDEFQTFTKQVKPTQLGNSLIKVVSPHYHTNAEIRLFVGENRTVTTEQYWEENPELAPWNNKPEPEQCFNQWCEPIPNLFAEQAGTPDEDTTLYTDDEHFNETRKKQGLPPINNTLINSEPSSEPNTMIKVYGYVINNASPFSASTSSFISDVNVCVWDYDSSDSSMDGKRIDQPQNQIL